MLTLKEKLLARFSDERLVYHISAANDEAQMRRSIEECLSRMPIESEGPSVAVDIGTYHGISAALLAEYFDVVHTFDIVTGYFTDADIKFDIWQFLDVSDKIIFHMIANDAEKKKILDALSFDFAFVDGQHKGGVDKDFFLVSRCKRVLFHDYSPEKKTGGGIFDYVVNFIDSLGVGVVYKDNPFAVWLGD